jgi:hypothetical protein
MRFEVTLPELKSGLHICKEPDLLQKNQGLIICLEVALPLLKSGPSNEIRNRLTPIKIRALLF